METLNIKKNRPKCKFFKLTEYPMNKNIFFHRIEGIIFGSLSWTTAFCSFTIAVALYIKVDPSYSIFTHYLSDLGAGKNYSNLSLFIGLALTTNYQILFYYSIGLTLKQKKSNWKLIKIAMGTAIIGSMSLFTVIPFISDPGNPKFNIMHGILGGIHFGLMAIAFLFYGISELLNPFISNKFTIISFSSALFYGLNLIFSNIYIFYWLAIVGIFLWVFVHIIFLIRSKE